MQQQRLGVVGIRDANALRQRVCHEHVVRVRTGDVVSRCRHVDAVPVEPVLPAQVSGKHTHTLDVLLQVGRQAVEHGL